MYRKILLLGILIALLIAGCSSNNDKTPVSGTGIKILQETPEQAYLTYFELFNSKDRLAAYDLISPQNRQKASKKDFQEWLKTVPYKSEKVMYTVSSQEGPLAVTGIIKLIDVNETKAGLYSIFALVKEENKWFVEMNVEGLDKEKGKIVDKLALDVHKKVKKALATGEINIDEKFKKQVEGQVDAFEKSVIEKIKTKSEDKSKAKEKPTAGNTSNSADKSKAFEESKDDH